mmetsp:Transcript_3889/g.17934  ORF Transcript_3889/g.17934 Transcript_3889/m.17934 type:complete len:241 (+) Transcript_3889:987-1709(+)
MSATWMLDRRSGAGRSRAAKFRMLPRGESLGSWTFSLASCSRRLCAVHADFFSISFAGSSAIFTTTTSSSTRMRASMSWLVLPPRLPCPPWCHVSPSRDSFFSGVNTVSPVAVIPTRAASLLNSSLCSPDNIDEDPGTTTHGPMSLPSVGQSSVPFISTTSSSTGYMSGLYRELYGPIESPALYEVTRALVTARFSTPGGTLSRSPRRSVAESSPNAARHIAAAVPGDDAKMAWTTSGGM